MRWLNKILLKFLKIKWMHLSIVGNFDVYMDGKKTKPRKVAVETLTLWVPCIEGLPGLIKK